MHKTLIVSGITNKVVTSYFQFGSHTMTPLKEETCIAHGHIIWILLYNVVYKYELGIEC